MNKHKCRTYFLIAGGFEPEEILRKLEVKTDKIQRRGEINHKKKTISIRDEIKIGFNDKYNVDINEMIRETLKEIISKAEALAELKKEYDLDYSLVLVPEIYSDSEKPNQLLSLDRDIIEFLYLTDTVLDLDYYVY